VNPLHFIPSMVSVIVFYFTTAPIVKVMTGADPMSPEHLAERRAAVIDFITAALFTSQNARNGTWRASPAPHVLRKGGRSEPAE
jgi:hypothetical protein